MDIIRKLLQIDFVRFCMVGALGFSINYVILNLLNQRFHSPLYVAQFVAAEIALFSNFLFHHRWTYKANKVRKTITVLIVQFHATSWIAVIGSVLMVTAGVKIFHLNNFTALAVSSAVALLWNFSWSKYVIWRSNSGSRDSGPTQKTSETL